MGELPAGVVEPKDRIMLVWDAHDVERLADVPENDDGLFSVRSRIGGCFEFLIVGSRISIGWLVGRLADAEGSEP